MFFYCCHILKTSATFITFTSFQNAKVLGWKIWTFYKHKMLQVLQENVNIATRSVMACSKKKEMMEWSWLGPAVPCSLLTWCSKHWTEMEKWVHSWWHHFYVRWSKCAALLVTVVAEAALFSHMEAIRMNRSKPCDWHSSPPQEWTQKGTGIWCGILLLYRVHRINFKDVHPVSVRPAIKDHFCQV